MMHIRHALSFTKSKSRSLATNYNTASFLRATAHVASSLSGYPTRALDRQNLFLLFFDSLMFAIPRYPVKQAFCFLDDKERYPVSTAADATTYNTRTGGLIRRITDLYEFVNDGQPCRTACSCHIGFGRGVHEVESALSCLSGYMIRLVRNEVNDTRWDKNIMLILLF